MATPLKLRLVRWMSAICVCLSLDACSQPVDQANLSQIHAIAVASACGREITRASIAFLAFGNEITKGDISEWGMDDLAVGIVQDSLPGNIQVRKAEFDAAKLAAANGALLFNPWSSNAVRPEPGVDAYLLITPAPAGGEGADALVGFGLHSRGPGLTAHTICFANLLDGRMYRRIGFSIVRGLKSAPNSLRLDRWSDYGPREQQQVRLILSDTLRAGLYQALQDMHLAAKPASK